jgi:FkbM family methyltransferase
MIPKISIVELNHGKYMIIPNDQGLVRKIFDSHSKRSIDPLLQISTAILEAAENRVMLDIGANAGSFTIPIALNFNKDYKFYCFELQRIVYYQLCGNIFLNSLPNVHCHHLALSNKNGIFEIPLPNEFYNSCGNIGGYSIDGFSLSKGKEDFPDSIYQSKTKEKVPYRTLDSLTEIPAAGLIKVDVEGHELEVLEGATKYIERSGYPPIIFEAWDYDWYKPKFFELRTFLKKIGYNNITNETSDNNYLAQSDFTNSVKLTFTHSASGKQIIRHTKSPSKK